MAVSVQDVRKIAHLAKLHFSETEEEHLTGELNEILHYMEQLNELDTEHVEPLYHVLELSNVLRKDVIKPSLPQEQALQNAPLSGDGFFKVPKVLG